MPLRIATILFALFWCQEYAYSQADSSKTYHVAVFAPLYLDSAFDDNIYQPPHDVIPKYIMPGLDFYNGIMMAVNQLKDDGVSNLEVHVYDTRKKGGINKLTAGLTDKHFSLMIAAIHNPEEQKALSEYSLKNNVPLVSATYPNEAGIENNPFFIMANSTLKTHIGGLSRFVQKVYPAARVIYVTRKGGVESMISREFDNLNNNPKGLKYKKLELKDGFKFTELSALMDTTVQNIFICGSLNENFGNALVKALDTARSYKTVAVGLPTWDGIKAFDKKENKRTEVIYTTPYNFDKNNNWTYSLTKKYKDKFLARPSDMVFKGFEAMYRFTRLLEKYPGELINHISEKTYNVWNSYNFEPAKIDQNDMVPDYLENKKLYFISKLNGNTKVL